MIRHISALAALAALSFSSVACMAPTESEATEVEETTQDLVSESAYFETFQGVDGRFYFNVMAENGERVLRSQAYTTLGSAEKGVAAVLANANDQRRFEVLVASNGDHYFNVKAANGEIIGTSELFPTRASADRAARTVRGLVRLAQQEARTQAAPRRERFELFTGEDGKAYFRLRAGNGEILLASQAYTARSSAKDGIASVQRNGIYSSRFDVFEAFDGGFSIRLVAPNGEVIARGETYASQASAERAVTSITKILAMRVGIAE